VSAINVAEVLDVLVRHQGWPGDDVEERLRWLTLGGLRVVPVDEAVAVRAGRLHAHFYDRSRRPLSMADCVALATALLRGQPFATSDPALAAVATAEGCRVIALPDSRGVRPGQAT
jgi:PIN domain nuclease of toxin-antitoxin system